MFQQRVTWDPFVTAVGFGTDAMHPRRERTNINVEAHTAIQIRHMRADPAALPYAEDLFPRMPAQRIVTNRTPNKRVAVIRDESSGLTKPG